ncbi:MAG: hypothetical protein JOZ78_17420 [Chroococcidiopsidaceae cyanobacterium CP_BM_ER_R8_30]|nr:hypothetical protein [Chroococcidiopsidaceae cyanobacterium CP_BM_ER_R8_30]
MSDQTSPDDKLKELECKKTQKEIAKTDIDIEIAKWSKKYAWFSTFVPSVSTALLALIGLVWSGTQFFSQLRNDKESKKVERIHDFIKSYSEKQISTYFALSEAAATVAAVSMGSKEEKDAQIKFIQLYQGDAWIVGDEIVREAMDNFYGCLDKQDPKCLIPELRPQRLRLLSRNLADACRASMAMTVNEDEEKSFNRITNFYKPYPEPTIHLPD